MSKFRTLVQHHPDPFHTQNPQESWDEFIEPISCTQLDQNHRNRAREDSDKDEKDHEDLFDFHSKLRSWIFNIFKNFSTIQ